MKYVSETGLSYFKTKLMAAITTQLATKVDAVEGKVLSSNDYTTTEKEKLAGLSNYTLPIATSEALGGIKIGAGLAINAETGVLSVTNGGVADSVDWSGIQSKPTTVAGYGITDTYTKTETNALIANLDYADSAVENKYVSAVSEVDGVIAVTRTNLPDYSTVYDAIGSAAAIVGTAGDAATANTVYGAKAYADSLVVSAYNYKGTYESLAALQAAVTTPAVGDVYNLSDTGMNTAWNGTAWDDLGASLSGYVASADLVEVTNAEIDAMFA